jgi:glycerol uptake facilitator-like aquaporin
MGFAVMALVWSFGDFGGAHFNPALSICLALTYKITFSRGMDECGYHKFFVHFSHVTSH